MSFDNEHVADLNKMYRGKTKSEISSIIIENFDEYFIYKDRLINLANNGVLIYERFHFDTIIKEFQMEFAVKFLVDESRKAMQYDLDQYTVLLNKIKKDISLSHTKYSDMYRMTAKKHYEIFTEEVAHIFDIIGKFTEVGLKSYIRYYYGCYCILNDIKLYGLHSKSLGKMVSELIDYNEVYKMILFTIFNDIKLSTLRNVSYHSNYKVYDKKIEINYIENKKRTQRKLEIKELSSIITKLDIIRTMFKICETISYGDFGIDYYQKLHKMDISHNDVIQIVSDTCKINGYIIYNVEISEKKVTFVVQPQILLRKAGTIKKIIKQLNSSRKLLNMKVVLLCSGKKYIIHAQK